MIRWHAAERHHPPSSMARAVNDKGQPPTRPRVACCSGGAVAMKSMDLQMSPREPHNHKGRPLAHKVLHVRAAYGRRIGARARGRFE